MGVAVPPESDVRGEGTRPALSVRCSDCARRLAVNELACGSIVRAVHACVSFSDKPTAFRPTRRARRACSAVACRENGRGR
jgi:hypothetical protein